MMEHPNKKLYLKRQIIALIIIIAFAFLIGFIDYQKSRNSNVSVTNATVQLSEVFLASDALSKLAVKDRVSKENYSRDEFGKGWQEKDGCDTRNYILQRDFESEVISNVNGCDVLKGLLKNDPYTGITINFVRGPDTSDDVQIDHIVPLSDAWQKGAQDLTLQERQQLANDPLNLLAVEGKANMQKSDKDASNWLPQQDYRCRYVARQIAVKQKYRLWVTKAEYNAMKRVLYTCPGQVLPVKEDV